MEIIGYVYSHSFPGSAGLPDAWAALKRAAAKQGVKRLPARVQLLRQTPEEARFYPITAGGTADLLAALKLEDAYRGDGVVPTGTAYILRLSICA